MPTIRTRLAEVLRSIDPIDIVLVVGLIMLAYGLWLLHPAAPWIVLGALFVAAWAGVGAPPRAGA